MLRPPPNKSYVVDRDGLMFLDSSEAQESGPSEAIEQVRRTGSWMVQTRDEPWLLVGPIVDATGKTHGVAAFEFSTAELSRDLRQMKSAVLWTALLVTVVGCLAGFLLARRATRPFDRLVGWVQDPGARGASGGHPDRGPVLAEADRRYSRFV